MFASDDLAPLLTPKGEGDLGFRQGIVTAWDRDTGANMINVGGAELVNVPILNTAEAVSLAAGHMVALLRFKSSYFILGRVTLPGSDQFAAAAVAFDAQGRAEQNFSLNATWTARATRELYGPAWATEAIVYSTAVVTAFNATGGVANLGVRASYDGTPSTITVADLNNNRWGTVTTAQTDHVFRDNFDTDPITVACEVAASPNIAAVAGNVAQIHAFAIFRRDA